MEEQVSLMGKDTVEVFWVFCYELGCFIFSHYSASSDVSGGLTFKVHPFVILTNICILVKK